MVSRDRPADAVVAGSILRHSDLAGDRAGGHALRVRSPGGVGASRHRSESDGREFVLIPGPGGDRLKILYWDKDGFALWYKRLEEGTFKLPRIEPGQSSIELRASELAMMLDGIDLRSIRRVKRFSRKKVVA